MFAQVSGYFGGTGRRWRPRGSADRAVRHRGTPTRGIAVSLNLVLHWVSRDGVGERAEELLGTGFRLALVAGHDDGDRLRVVYLYSATASNHPIRQRHSSSSTARLSGTG